VAADLNSISQLCSGDLLNEGEATSMQPITNRSNALHLLLERYRSIYTTENAAVVNIFSCSTVDQIMESVKEHLYKL